MQKLLVIVGPTGSGKTALAVRLARKLNGEIISADSRQVYKGMFIGTGRATRAELRGVREHMTGIIRPDESFTVAEYKERAEDTIARVAKRGKVPILVGGTGLYVQAVVENWEIPEVPPQPKLRRQLEKKSLQELQRMLKGRDPASVAVVQMDNRRRVIRALEVVMITGKSFVALRKKGALKYDVLQIGIVLPREKLYERIDARVDEMFRRGLVCETQQLLKKYSPRLPALSGIGYKEVAAYVRGDISRERAVELIKFWTHEYARRQISWFKRGKTIRWVKLDKGIDATIKRWFRA